MMARRSALAGAIVAFVAGCQSTADGSASSAGTATPPAVIASPTPAREPPTATPSPAPEPLAWSLVDVAGGPAAREDHTWTLSGDGETAFLFGGRDGATVFGDLWAFDVASETWERLSASGPAARFGHEAAWVDGVGLVVFAGQSGAAFFDDLWAFDPDAGTWERLPSAGDAPVARYGTCAALGPDGRLWMSHGFTADGTRFSDTRAYDFDSGTWSDETPDGVRPIERCLHGCWWTDEAVLALYAGQTTGITALGDRWTLGERGWTEVSGTLPPERNLYARVRLDGSTLVFGGQALDGSFLGDAWLFTDGSSDAVPLEVAGGPPRAAAELVRDVGRSRILLFGGRDGEGAHADLWQLTGDIGG